MFENDVLQFITLEMPEGHITLTYNENTTFVELKKIALQKIQRRIPNFNEANTQFVIRLRELDDMVQSCEDEKDMEWKELDNFRSRNYALPRAPNNISQQFQQSIRLACKASRSYCSSMMVNLGQDSQHMSQLDSIVDIDSC